MTPDRCPTHKMAMPCQWCNLDKLEAEDRARINPTPASAKPREFWIDEDQHEKDDEESIYFGDAYTKHPHQGPLQWQYGLIHVIEKSAHDALKVELDETRALLKAEEARVFEYAGEIARLKGNE